jgi:hypothetical protein
MKLTLVNSVIMEPTIYSIFVTVPQIRIYYG